MRFWEPFDVEYFGAPDYYEIVKQPMDMRTIQEKLDSHQYNDEDDFAFDFRLMLQNCLLYNDMDHPITPICQKFQKAFEEKFSRLKQAKEKAKVSIFDKLDRKEKSLRQELIKYEVIVEDLKDKLEVVMEQRKEEEVKAQMESVMPVKPTAKRKREKSEKKKKSVATKRNTQHIDIPLENSKDQNDSEPDDSAASMTTEEIQTLMARLQTLSQENINEAIKIINKFEKNSADTDGEFDFETFKPVTQRALEKFVNECLKLKRGN